jgi:hypothetical protein
MSLNRLKAAVGAMLIAWLACAPALAAGEKPADKPIPPKPALPAIKSLRVEPQSLTLIDARDSRKVLVIGERVDGGVIDLTSEAKSKPDNQWLTTDEDGYHGKIRWRGFGDSVRRWAVIQGYGQGDRHRKQTGRVRPRR